LRGLFTRDARLHFPEARPEPYTLDEGMTLIIQVLEGCQSIHHGMLPEIDVTSATEATGIWCMEDRITWSDAAAAKTGVKTLHGFGRYREEYRDGGSGWQIRRLQLVRDLVNTSKV
jgi:SnoaL-like domain